MAKINKDSTIFLDLKTTSYDTYAAKPISCTILDYEGNVLMDCLIANNKEDGNLFSSEQVLPIAGFHNITQADLDERGVAPQQFYDDLTAIMSQYRQVVIYNAEFDASFLPKSALEYCKPYCEMAIAVAFINAHPSYQNISNYLKLNGVASLLEVNLFDLDLLTSYGDAELCRRV